MSRFYDYAASVSNIPRIYYDLHHINAYSDFDNDTVTFVIHEEQRTERFTIHLGLLCSHSGHFKQVFSTENDFPLKPIHLHHIEIITFSIFHEWLYHSELSATRQQALTLQHILILYAFSGAYLVPELANYALDLFFTHVAATGEFPVHLVTAIHSFTPPRSPLRMLYIDVLLEVWKCEAWHDVLPFFAPELLGDVLARAVTRGLVPGAGSVSGGLGVERWMEYKRSHFCQTYHRHAVVEGWGDAEMGDMGEMMEGSVGEDEETGVDVESLFGGIARPPTFELCIS